LAFGPAHSAAIVAGDEPEREVWPEARLRATQPVFGSARFCSRIQRCLRWRILNDDGFGEVAAELVFAGSKLSGVSVTESWCFSLAGQVEYTKSFWLQNRRLSLRLPANLPSNVTPTMSGSDCGRCLAH